MITNVTLLSGSSSPFAGWPRFGRAVPLALACLVWLLHGSTGHASTLDDALAVYLKFDGNYLDSSGHGIHGTPVGAPSFVAGTTGSGALDFSSDFQQRTFNYVTLGAPADLNFGANADFSMAFWFKGVTGPLPLLSNRRLQGQGWAIYSDGARVRESDGAEVVIATWVSPLGDQEDGRWHHIALTVERAGYARLFIDGVFFDLRTRLGEESSWFAQSFAGPGRPTVDTREGLAVNIGQDGAGDFSVSGPGGILGGKIDDLAIWRRRLSGSEVALIHRSGLQRRAISDIVQPLSPLVTSDPGYQSVPIGGPAVFRVTATGTEPLSYQWYFKRASSPQVPLPGANGPVLQIPEANLSHVGAYSVVVSNALGTNASQVALLRLEYPVTVVTEGLGSVRREPEQPSYSVGTVVRLFPEAAPGFVFVGWSGDASGETSPLEVTVQQSANITARFVSVLGEPANTGAGGTTVVATRIMQKGWNAVFLDVAPSSVSPGVLFSNTPIDTVATYFPFSSPVEFIRNPTDKPWKEKGWGVWYAPNHPEAFLTSLYAILPNRAYLVHCRQAFAWRFSADIQLGRLTWQPDSFNFVGLPVDPAAPPTFAQFFAGSTAHQRFRIYRLVDGGWVPISSPAQTPVEYGMAYWIHCRGGSSYQGPLDVRLPFGTEADFGNISSDLRIRLSNTSPNPMAVRAQTLGGAGSLPLTHRKRYLAEARNEYLPLAGALNLGTVESADVFDLNLTLQRSDLTSSASSTIIELTSDAGVRFRFAGRAQSAIPTQP